MNGENYRGADRRRTSDDFKSELLEALAGIHKEVAENTTLTASIKRDLDAHVTKTANVVAAWDKIEPGVKVMAGIGKIGEWCLDRWKPILIIGVAAKVVISGGGIAEAWNQLMRIFKTE